MYKLLIVDDEPLVQVGIKSMLDWNSINVEVCGIASNGKQALEIINKEFPHIVITDIKMPIMSGLELAKACKDNMGDNCPKFIVLTSYEDFNLVREAMHASVEDYLIKLELTPELLKDAINKITASLNEKPELDSPQAKATMFDSYHDKFFISLLHNLFESREQFELEAKELNLDFSGKQYLCSYIEMIAPEKPADDVNTIYHQTYQMTTSLFDKYQTCYPIPLDLHHFAMVFSINSEQCDNACKLVADTIQTVSDSIKNYYNVNLVAGIGTLVSDPLTITESYQYSRDAFNNITDSRGIISFEECQGNIDLKKSFNFSIFKDSLSKAYEEFDNNLLSSTLTDIIDLFKSHPGHYLQAMDCASNILYMSISLIPNGEEVVSSIFNNGSNGYKSLYSLTSMDQILGWLNYFKEGLCDYFIKHKKDTRKPIVTNIKHYITENIDDHLSLNEVAAVFGLSPNYLSQLFKKYNDCGFNEYVTNCKIDKARRLLNSGEYKVYEVAEMLGFENAFYFSKVFKKVVGVPPTEYMNKE